MGRRFASKGEQVVLGDLTLDGAERVAADIQAQGGTAVATHRDGRDEVSAAAAVALAQGTFGGLDGHHCNLARFVGGDFERGILKLPLDQFDNTTRTNLRGYYLCSRAALPALLGRGKGSIIYTSSPAAADGCPTQVAYATAKAGVEAIMRHVAARYGASDIHANCIAPGSTLHPRPRPSSMMPPRRSASVWRPSSRVWPARRPPSWSRC